MPKTHFKHQRLFVQADKIRSAETKTQISKTLTGNSIPEEVKRKISKSLKGRVFTENHKLNLSNAGKGRPVSLETRQKMSQSLKRKSL